MSDNIRQKQFKNTAKHESSVSGNAPSPWARAEGSLELRKQRKDEQLMKRRNVDLHDDTDATDDEQQNVPTSGKGVPTASGRPKSLQPMALLDCFNILENGGDYERRFKAVEGIRRHLSRQKNPPIDEVIKMGIVKKLVGLLDEEESPQLQFEAAWALTIITSGSAVQTKAAVDGNCILPLIYLLMSPDMQVAEQSAWALGNITGDSASLHNEVISLGILRRFLPLAKRSLSETTDSCKRAVAFTMLNLCRYVIPNTVAVLVVMELISVLAELINHPDTAVVCDVCWALAYISDRDKNRSNLVLKAGVLERMVQLASGSDMTLIAPSLRCLGNIVTGDEMQTQAVIDVLTTVVPVAFNSNKSALARESCWLLSNICAGNSQQILAVLDSGLINHVIQQLDKGEFCTQIEANCSSFNICSGGTTEQAVILLQQGALTGVCNILKTRETRGLLLALDTLGLLLALAAKIGYLEQATMLVEECEGLDQIEQLQNHENEDVHQKALQLVEKYFSETEEVGAGGDGPIQDPAGGGQPMDF